MKLHYYLLVCISLLSTNIAYAQKVDVQIIYTSDEHGWMINQDKDGGAAEMYDQWLLQDSIKIKKTLILSGGDNFTGPAISTYTKGQAMLEVMNAMGYQVSTIGNHEFDFGQTDLSKIINNARFQYVAANFTTTKSSKLSKRINPYSEISVNGVKFLIIGLANLETPTLSTPKNMLGLNFEPYIESLSIHKEKIKKADIAILLSHICANELKSIHNQLSEIGIDIIAGAHCHIPSVEIINNVPIIEGNPNLRGYAKIQIQYDLDSHTISSINAIQIPNNRLSKNTEISMIIEKWKDSTDKILQTPIAYADESIPIGSPEIINLILKSWINQFPNIDIAITNRGSIRQGIPKGDISLSTLIGIMPFDNELIIVEMTGKDIKELLNHSKPFVAGVDVNSDFLLSTGTKIADNSIYRILVNSFIYNGGDKYMIKEKSKFIANTGINMREPVRNIIMKLHSSWNKPINSYLDSNRNFEQ